MWDTSKLHVNSIERLRWSRGSVLAFGTQVSGFKPSGSRRILKGEKIIGTPFSPIVPPFAARISRVVADVEAPGSESGNNSINTLIYFAIYIPISLFNNTTGMSHLKIKKDSKSS
jgi:hypothetical protein